MLSDEQIARVCHEANRAYCVAIGDSSQLPWDEAPQWQRDSAIAGVAVVRADPRVHPIDLHQSWWAQKLADGWQYGPVKDAEAKTHPCMVPYHELPPEQRLKDSIFSVLAKTLCERDAQALVERRVPSFDEALVQGPECAVPDEEC